MATLTIHLPDPAATDAMADALAARLRPGDTLLLSGEIGAGKSHLARRMIQTLQRPHGAVEDVPSPTYTLVQHYRAGALRILHADLYRLGDPSEVVELGLGDALGRDICVIEWPDRLDETPPDALFVALAADGGGRVATLSGDDTRWAEPLGHVGGAVHA